MRLQFLFIGLLVCVIHLFSQQNIDKHVVWIDTDPAAGLKNRDVDDGLALVQAFHSPEIEIRGISAVFGNASLKEGFPIARKLVKEFAGKNIPVYKGAASSKELGKETAASIALGEALKKEKLVVFVLGPATNVATVIQKYPHLTKNIVELIAVAGRRPGQRFQTGDKNKKAHRDFNFELDPKAFEIILASNIPLTLAPFEISSQVWMTENDLNIMATGNPACKWLAKAARGWLKLWQDVFFVNGFNPFDTLAIAYITSPHLIKYEDLFVEIQILPDDLTEERMQGVKVDNKPYLLISNKWKSKRKVRYCYRPMPEFKQDLLARLMKK